MKTNKLALDPESLQVASFTTNAAAPESRQASIWTEPILITTWITAAIC